MQYRQLGQSDLKISVISFGAWAIGGWKWNGTDDAAAIRAINAALDLGINCIDTAAIYGFGHSEHVVGEAIKNRRDEVVIATKCCIRWDKEEGEFFFDTEDEKGNPIKIYKNMRPASIKWECEQSLKRLKVDAIDLYQCHWPDATTPLEDTMDAFLELQREGKIRAIGMSNFEVGQLERCIAKGTVASLQPKYNALERKIETELLPFCKLNNIGVLPYSPIAQGLLTGTVTLDRVFGGDDNRKDKPLFKPENRQKILDMLNKVQPIAKGHSATLGQLFIAWTIAQPGITSALVGARNEAQVQENAKAADITLSEIELQDIRSEVEALDFV